MCIVRLESDRGRGSKGSEFAVFMHDIGAYARAEMSPKEHGHRNGRSGKNGGV